MPHAEMMAPSANTPTHFMALAGPRFERADTSQDEMCNMYMMTYSELPVFMTCGNGQGWYQVDGPGGVPPGSSMAPESPAVWQPPPPAGAGVDAELALGQIAGA